MTRGQIVVKTPAGALYFYLGSVGLGGLGEYPIQHILASVNTGRIISLPSTVKLSIEDECLIKMRKDMYVE